MFSDIDHANPEVREDLFHWVKWLSSQVKLGGLRLDAVKHYSAKFLRDLLLHIDQTVDRDWFIVGEYWRGDSDLLARYIEYMNNRISLFDVKLLENFSKLSMRENSDLRTILAGSLVEIKPNNAVVSALLIRGLESLLNTCSLKTFVANHDTVSASLLPLFDWYC